MAWTGFNHVKKRKFKRFAKSPLFGLSKISLRTCAVAETFQLS